MTKYLGCYPLIISLGFLFSGCALRTERRLIQLEEAKSDKNCPVLPIKQPVLAVPSIPSVPLEFCPIEHWNQNSKRTLQLHHYDWNSTMQPMVGNLLQVQGLNVGSLLLVDNVNNRTNGLLNSEEATASLRKALVDNGKFILVSTSKLSAAKQQLGLSPKDSLSSSSKAIGIARNVRAQYVLYSNATGNVNAPSLQMKLMFVPTGEIIWSEKGTVVLL